MTTAEEKTSQPQKSNLDFSPLYKLLPRLMLSFTLICALYVPLWPAVGSAIATLSAKLILTFSPIPYLESLTWTKYGYAIADRLVMTPKLFAAHSLPFLLGFPLAFALALPDLRSRTYLRRLFWTSVLSFFVCVFSLLIVAERFADSHFAGYGINLHNATYSSILRTTISSDVLWDFSMSMYPFIICVVMARSCEALSMSKETRTSKQSSPIPSRLNLIKPDLVAFSILALFLAFAFLRADTRQSEAPEQMTALLRERNPLLSESLILMGDQNLLSQKSDSALRLYRLAKQDRRYSRAAEQRIRQVSRAAKK